MRESVPTARYSPVCNVLRQWKTSLIPTYRVLPSLLNYPNFPYIIESVDSINRDERGFPLTQYITNWGISRAR